MIFELLGFCHFSLGDRNFSNKLAEERKLFFPNPYEEIWSYLIVRSSIDLKKRKRSKIHGRSDTIFFLNAPYQLDELKGELLSNDFDSSFYSIERKTNKISDQID